jgi:hypothetical protein
MTLRAILAGVVALALSGCGTASLPSTRLRLDATRVCAHAVARSALIEPPAVPARTGAFLRRGIAVLIPELAELRALTAPSEQAGAYSDGLAALAREVTLLAATAHGLDRGADPVSAVKTLQRRLAPVESDGNAAWTKLRVPACLNR